MEARRALALLLLLATAALAVPFPASSPCECAADPVRVATFNTNQEEGSLYAGLRSSATTEFFSRHVNSFDVVCLQGIFDETQRMSLLHELHEEFPFSYHPDSVTQSCTRACNDAAELDPIFMCLSDNLCMEDELAASQQIDCAFQFCSREINQVTLHCQSCLGTLPERPFQERFGQCGGFNVSDPSTWQDCRFLYNGQTDPIILSRFPIASTQAYYFANTSVTANSIAYARVDFNATDDPYSLRSVHVFCTRLNSQRPGFDTETENRMQILETIAFVRETVNSTSPTEATVIMGDFGVGPARGSSIALFDQNYQLLVDSQFRNTFFTFGGQDCTMCSDNPLATDSVDRVVDHIFVPEGSGVCTSNSSIFATESVVAVNATGNPDEFVLTVPLSKHFGVLSSICPAVPAAVTTGGATTGAATQEEHPTKSSASGLLSSTAAVVCTVVVALQL